MVDHPRAKFLGYLRYCCNNHLEYSRLLDFHRSGELSWRRMVRHQQQQQRNPIIALRFRPGWDRTPRRR